MAKNRNSSSTPDVRVAPISELVPDPSTLRVRDARAVDTLAASLRELGAGRSVVVDKNGTVLAGNGTLEAAKSAGIEEVIIVETNGRQLVVVKRPDWSPEQALAYAIADNRTGDLSKFDYEGLGAALSSLQSAQIHVVGFDPGELEMLLSAEWRPTETVPVDSYTRSPPTAKDLVLTIDAEHAEEISAAIQRERAAGALTDSAALVRLVRRAPPP